MLIYTPEQHSANSFFQVLQNKRVVHGQRLTQLGHRTIVGDLFTRHAATSGESASRGAKSGVHSHQAESIEHALLLYILASAISPKLVCGLRLIKCAKQPPETNPRSQRAHSRICPSPHHCWACAAIHATARRFAVSASKVSVPVSVAWDSHRVWPSPSPKPQIAW